MAGRSFRGPDTYRHDGSGRVYSRNRSCRGKNEAVLTSSPFRALAQTIHAVTVAPEKWAYASGLLSPRRLNLPEFLGIGAQKAGTTWLHEMLCGHPELYLASPQEVHYFA